MSKLYESEAFRGLTGQEYHGDLPGSRISFLFERLFAIEQQGQIAIAAILVPENPTTGPIEVFIAPANQEIGPPDSTLQRFNENLILSLRMAHAAIEKAGTVFKNNVAQALRDYVEDGSLYVPSITFTEVFNEQIQEVTKRKKPLVGNSPIIDRLGLAPLLERSEDTKGTTEKGIIEVVIYTYPNKQIAQLTAKSIMHLIRQPSLLPLTDRHTITRCVPQKYLTRSRLPNPESYLREWGIIAS